MHTTIDIADDVLAAAKELADSKGATLGEVLRLVTMDAGIALAAVVGAESRHLVQLRRVLIS